MILNFWKHLSINTLWYHELVCASRSILPLYTSVNYTIGARTKQVSKAAQWVQEGNLIWLIMLRNFPNPSDVRWDAWIWAYRWGLWYAVVSWSRLQIRLQAQYCMRSGLAAAENPAHLSHSLAWYLTFYAKSMDTVLMHQKLPLYIIIWDEEISKVCEISKGFKTSLTYKKNS